MLGRSGPARNGRTTLVLLSACSIAAACVRPASPGTSVPVAARSPVGPTDTRVGSVTKPPAGWLASACNQPLDYLRRIRRGYFPGRSPDVFMLARHPNFFGSFGTTTHSGPWAYLQEVPLVFYGPGFIRSRGPIALRRETTLADIAPTLADLTGTRLSDRLPGRPIRRALLPPTARSGRTPKLIVVVVWDGGGWNVLRTWPDSWPFLRKLMQEGTTLRDAIVGSSPSVTPAVHATIGTGAFPNQHGVVDMWTRSISGDVIASFADRSPRLLALPTLADEHDKAVGNEAQVGMMSSNSFHLGMMGHGSYLPGGDRDIQVIAPYTRSITFETHPSYYVLPAYVDDIGGFRAAKRAVDVRDGESDGRWRGHDLGDWHEVHYTPVWVRFQTRIIETVLRRERFGRDRVTDLFFTNYKQIDNAGHVWNMLAPEMSDLLQESDRALATLVSFLNRSVGRKGWVLVVTADHGQAPRPEVVDAYPIHMVPLLFDTAEHFGLTFPELIDGQRPTGIWLDHDGMAAAGISAGDVANFLIGYRLEDNVPEGVTLPPGYQTRRDELIISAAWPSDEMDRVWACAKRTAE